MVENKGRNQLRWLTPNLRLQITHKIPENDVLWGPQPEVDKLLKLTKATESFYKIKSLEIYMYLGIILNPTTISIAKQHEYLVNEG